MTKQRGRKAWLVTWESPNKKELESPIAAIFSSRLGSETVRGHIEVLYSATHYGGDEQLRFLVDSSANPYPAVYNTVGHRVGEQTVQVPYQGQILCGHNPYLYGRRVTDLRLGSDTYPDGSQQLTWKEIPKPGFPDW